MSHVTIGSGKYYYVPVPYCEKCSLPIRPNSQCNKCYFCFNFNDLEYFEYARALGLYFTPNYEGQLDYIRKHPDDLLSIHIRGLKYRDKFAYPLGLAMTYTIYEKFEEFFAVDYLIPMPLHPTKLAERGYNQAEELGKVISDRIDIPLVSNALTKVKDVNMRGKPRGQKKIDIKGAFEAKRHFNHKSVLLIDDVLTSGFSANECAKMLKENGVNNVYVFVAGRAVPKF